MPILKGSRLRPRVGLVGIFEEEISSNLKALFPTTWTGKTFGELSLNVHHNEIDLIIIAPNTPNQIGARPFLDNAHVISFSNTFSPLPGLNSYTNLAIIGKTSTEEYIIPEQPLNYYNLLEYNISTENAKGWPVLGIHIHFRDSESLPDDMIGKIFQESSLYYDPHTNYPFASKYIRLDSHLGVACLPGHFFDIVPWVEIICQEWAIDDQERFPNFRDWTKVLEWMTHEEELLNVEIDKTTDELERITTDYKKRISDLRTSLLETSLKVNKEQRRLITSQGDDLLQETASAFVELGYRVKVMDQEIKEGIPKKEDLRIYDPDEKNWEAIVEVRGHAKSSGQTSDLSRLFKFARLYQAETGHPPNKLIYAVNGQIEILSPLERQEPFSSAPDDVAAFGEQDGIIIWTVDLFKILKDLQIKGNIQEIRKSLRESTGIWRFINLSKG